MDKRFCGCSSGAEYMLIMCEVLGSMPSTPPPINTYQRSKYKYLNYNTIKFLIENRREKFNHSRFSNDRQVEPHQT